MNTDNKEQELTTTDKAGVSFNPLLSADAIPKGNHRWKDNKCIRCGVTRVKKTFRYRMAITNHPPYDHYIYEQVYIYSDGEQTRRERPYCTGSGSCT